IFRFALPVDRLATARNAGLAYTEVGGSRTRRLRARSREVADQGHAGVGREAPDHHEVVTCGRVVDRAGLAVAVEERPAVEHRGGRPGAGLDVEVGVAGPAAEREHDAGLARR